MERPRYSTWERWITGSSQAWGYYVRVHPCKLRLATCSAQQSSKKEDTTKKQQTQSEDPNKEE